MEKIELSQSEADAQLIRQKLFEFNFNRVPHDNHQTLYLIARRQGVVIAGPVGDTYWSWLYISFFWVDEHERDKGLGSKILAKAEEIAVQQGCKKAHLETHDFQNLQFYLKRGYEIFGKLDDLPEGHTKYYLCKSIPEK